MSDPAHNLKPRDERDVEDAVQWALANGTALEIVGHGSKRTIGRPAQTDATLDLSGLAGVTLYEPEELVLSARAGTPLADIEALVAAKNQMLAFEPMDYGPLLGAPAGRGTIGGALAANLSGPRRIKAGAARDHFLGFTAVSGRGETFKSGGRVVKNVTGYDLCKLMAGSWGTLAAMTEVTVKVLPRPETEETLTILGLTEAGAIRAMSAAMGSPCDVSGAAHLPAGVAERIAGPWAAQRRDGPAARRRSGFGRAPQTGAEGPDAAAWRARPARRAGVRARSGARSATSTPFAAEGVSGRPVWRISTAPGNGAELGAMIASQVPAELLYDWAGGLVWAAPVPADDAGAAPCAVPSRRSAAMRASCARLPRRAPRSTCSSRRNRGSPH